MRTQDSSPADERRPPPPAKGASLRRAMLAGRFGLASHGALLLLILTFASWGANGHVRAIEGRFEGPITVRASEVQAGPNTSAWDSVLHVFFDPQVRTFPKPHRVVLANGEEWRVAVAGLSGGKLALEFDLFGARELPEAHVAMIEFEPETARGLEAVPGMLYLKEGEPLPGKLLWIDKQNLALDSLFGVLTLPRDRVVRYVFEAPAPAGARQPEDVRLVDGSLFQGVITPQNDQLILRHPALGALTLPVSILRSITKSVPGARSLSSLRLHQLESFGPISGAPVEGAIEHQRHDSPQDSTGRFLRSVTIHPKTRAAYEVPADLRNGATFKATLAPIPGARGSSRLKIVADSLAVYEIHVPSGQSHEPLEVAIPPARELALEVDYGERIGFPCGVRLLDAYLESAPSRNHPLPP